MNALEEMKARLEVANLPPLQVWVTENLRWADIVPESDSDNARRFARCADDDQAELFANAPADMAKLIAVLEAVEALLADRAIGFRETSDRLNQQVLDRDPGMDAETAHRYAIHAQSSESALRMIQRTIAEALA